MVTVHYRRWCPPQSPLRIEFPPELLHDVRLEAMQPARALPSRWMPRFNRVVNQSSGLLFGVRHEDEVRVLAARAHSGDDGHANPDGLARVGTFVCRARGEVFLTDDDLANFEKHEGVLALVVAGGQAGFFVRESDGSVQAIRSHEEFQVADAAAQPVSRKTAVGAELPAPAPRWHAWRRVAACAALLAIPAGAFAYLRPLIPRLPIALAIREEAGQLVIGWNAGALNEGSRLEITDGSERTILMLPANTSSATYGLQGGDVEVRLSTDSRMGGAHWEAAHFATRPARTPPASNALRDRIGALTIEARKLRRSLADGNLRTEQLAARMDELTTKPEQ
ncbi:MAG: hypothetical protein JWO19_5492 [Bryobacterales bacterium]|nr:hypothetical protein [Bryobacterales bacterium]